ncbi:MAG TPA: ribosome-binding factor A [Candidatus Paceibacterota bacterium]|nr:ribosome-binding factor A [Candidatus Paceibacterota bacterium]
MSTYRAPSRRQNKVSEEIAHQAGIFLVKFVRAGGSLITVTRADIAPDLKNVTVFVSVLPKSHEEEILHTLKRLRTDFHDYLKDVTVLRDVPTVDFEIDIGEANRQRIEELTRK